MKAYGGADIQTNAFLSSALDYYYHYYYYYYYY
jgi:hypothetical protein